MRRTLISLLLHLGLITKSRRHRRNDRTPTAEALEDRVMMYGGYAHAEEVAVQESDTGTVNAVFTVTISTAATYNVRVPYFTAGITAHEDADYQHAEGTLTFTPGVTALPVTVSVAGDVLNEADEKFFFHVDYPAGAASWNYAFGTITDQDAAPTVSIGDAPPVAEGQAASSPAVFSITVSEPSGRPITVNYATVSNTALAGEDFQTALGAVVIQPGETLKTIAVSVNGDVRQEDEETFFLDIVSADHAILDVTRATGTILAEDHQFLATGAGAGGGPHVRVFDPLTGEERFGFFAYDESFTGGVRTATADVNADGKPDIITGAGPGGGPHVRVFDGQTGEQLGGDIGSFYAYDSSFTGGVFVAAGDLDGDGWADVITGADAGGGPHVRAFSGLDGSELASFFAYDSSFSGGVRVAVADVDGDMRPDIITGAGPGGGPHVRVFDANGDEIDHDLSSFYAYDSSFTGGIFVAAGDVNGDNQVDLISGADAGGNPLVRVFDGRTGEQMAGEIGSFLAYDSSFSGGVRVAAAYVDGDERLDIVTAAGAGGGPHVRAFRARDGAELSSYFAYASSFSGGVYVGGHGPIALPPGGIVDPLEVFDAVNGLLLREDVIELAGAGLPVDLRAQVWGGTVDTYEWDFSQAPDAINVTGDETARLQFEWDEEAEGQQIITITTVNTDLTEQSRTLVFFVEAVVDAGQGLFDEAQPAVVTQDQQRSDQELVREEYYELSLNSGELYVPHALPSYNPGAPRLELVYSSAAADPRPIFLVRHGLDPDVTPPGQVSAQLTLNSVAGATIYYYSAAQNPGNVLQIALPGDATGLSTGRYAWSIEVKELHGSPITTNYNGYVNIINSDASELGDGWGLSGLDRLHVVSGGIILEMERGTSLWFEEDGMGGFLTPAGDFSTLVENMDGTFTRTMKDGYECHFSSAGLLTSCVDRNDNTIEYAYSSGKLTSITDANELETTFSYTGNRVTTITDPADRDTLLAYDGSGRLTSITDPDEALWEYEYDSDDRMTLLVNPREFEWAFVLDAAGRVEQVNRPDATEEALIALQTIGLAGPSEGTSMNPADAALFVEAAADYTDARGHHWLTRLDYGGFGLAVEQINPLEYRTATRRGVDGLTYIVQDALDYRTRYVHDTDGNVVERIDADGHNELFEYNGFSQVTRHTLRDDNFWRYEYDSDGNLTDMIVPDEDDLDPEDPDLENNPRWVYTYDGDGNQLTEEDPLGFVTTFDYDARDRLEAIVYPDDDMNAENNPTVELTYTDASHVETRTNERGFIWSFVYDGMNRLVEETRPDDDMNGANNPVYAWVYDAAGNLEEATDPLLHTTEYVYDELNRLIETTNAAPGCGCSPGETTIYGLDANGNITSVTNAENETTTFTFDSVNQQTAVTNALENTWHSAFDPLGRNEGQTDPVENTETTSFHFNTPWITSTLSTLGGASTWTLNPLGLWINFVPADGSCCDRVFCTSNLLCISNHHIAGGSAPTTFTHDPNRQITQITAPDPDGEGPLEAAVTQMTFTPRGWLESVEDAVGHVTEYEYDEAGNLTSVTESPPTLYEYDAQNRLVKVTDPEGGETEYAYDLAGRLISVTDSEENTTEYEYDEANRLIVRTDPLENETLYVYDDAGRLVRLTDRNGRVTEYAYDDAGRRTAEIWLDAEEDPIHTISFAYDDADRLIETSDAFSHYTLTYEVATGQRIHTDNLGTPGVPHVVVTRYVDQMGRLAGVTDLNPDPMHLVVTTPTEGSGTQNEVQEVEVVNGSAGREFTLTFDSQTTALLPAAASAAAVDAALEALSTIGAGNVAVSGAAGGPWTIEFVGALALENVPALTWDHPPEISSEVDYTYGYSGFLAEIDYVQDLGAENVTHTVEFTVDNLERPTQMRRYAESTENEPLVTDLGYDVLNRLTSITHSYDATELSEFLYTYNLLGELEEYVGPGGDVEYAYDDTRQLTGATGDRTESYSYDTNGNRVTSHLHDDDYVTGPNNQLLSDGVFDYTFDNEGNRLTKEEVATGTITSYTWDHRNRLTSVVVTNSSEVVISEAHFTYDVFDNLIIREIDADGAGSGEAEILATVYNGNHPWADYNAEGELLTHYLYGEHVDQIMARIASDGEIDWYNTDLLGSVRQIVASDGDILDEINYDSFLNILTETAPSAGDRFKGAAREYEAAVDLYFNRARWYDPADGRFISEDPIHFAAGDVNLLRYALNRPADRTDPLGTLALPPACPPQVTVVITVVGGAVIVSYELGKECGQAIKCGCETAVDWYWDWYFKRKWDEWEKTRPRAQQKKCCFYLCTDKDSGTTYTLQYDFVGNWECPRGLSVGCVSCVNIGEAPGPCNRATLPPAVGR